jgi:Icc-related predicted phosphoesterase
MKLHLLSDLHLEFAPFTPPETDAEVVILAGDTAPGHHGVRWARDNFPTKPVLYLMGNHEFYGHEIPKLTQNVEEVTAGTNVHVMENKAVEIGKVVFLGCTLWTDFALGNDPSIGALVAEGAMNDFRRIRWWPGYSLLRAGNLRRLHADSVLWLRQQLVAHAGKKIVVLTHHAPSPRSIPPKFQGDPLNCAFASDLETLVMESKAQLWVHGHIHSQSDYLIGSTRVIANPRGYPREEVGPFNPELIVEV